MNLIAIIPAIVVLMLQPAITGVHSSPASAPHNDTVTITSKSINTAVLKDGTSRYLVYFKMDTAAARTQTQFWTRTITHGSYNGKAVITITQSWEDKDSIMHTSKAICDAQTLQPIYHDTWWKQRGMLVVDYGNKQITFNNVPLPATGANKQQEKMLADFNASLNDWFVNWHLDLEIFSTLPYRKNATFLVPFAEPGATAPAPIAYTVSGSAELMGYNDQRIDCWLLTHEDKGSKEVFWISKKTKEVLKLEQEINGKIYRYKLRLAFSR